MPQGLTRWTLVSLAAAAAVVASAGGAAAEDCPCPAPTPTPTPPPWKVTLGGGLTRTSGNTETSSYNIAAEVVYDPHTRNVVRASGLYLRTSQDDVTSSNRTFATARDEYTVNGRLFAFGNVEYQRDVFKGVEHVVAPLVGFGFKLVEEPKVTWSLDSGLGAAFEKLVDEDATTRLALNASNRLEWKPSATTSIVEKAGALWKTYDFGDAYYHAELGLVTSVAKHLEIKVAFVDDYKTKPPSPELEKNDTSFIVSLLLKL
jgi:putative salt-induced outer membrane protein